MRQRLWRADVAGAPAGDVSSSSDLNRLLSSVNALPPQQALQLREHLDRQITRPTKSPTQSHGKAAKRGTPEAAKRNSLTADEINPRLLAGGRLSSLPDPALDIDDGDPDDAPLPIKEQPLSETILRERR